MRFVSYEPALDGVSFEKWLPIGWSPTLQRWKGGVAAKPGPFLDWIIVGGESGPGARHFYAAWARDTVAQCKAAGVPCFVKQMGAYVVDRNDAGFDGCEPWEWPLRPDGGDPELEHDIHGYRESHQGADCRIRLVSRAGKDMAEWPADLRVREFPL